MPMFHLSLLGGLALVGVPIVLHLLLRQKPRQIRFPAFRFLRRQARTSQRRLRLRHLILLFLRMLLIALFCLALASLRGGDSGGALAIIIDTSPSMEYIVGGRSRLEEAKSRALQWLEHVSSDSRVAVIDTATASASWGSVAEARNRIANLQIRPGSVPVTTALASALRLFAEIDASTQAGPQTGKRRLLILSDRARDGWQSDRLADLREAMERGGDSSVVGVYIDLNVPQPIDVAITDVEVVPQPVLEGREVKLRVTVRAVGQDCETEVVCKLLGESGMDRKPVVLRAGEAKVVEFLGRSFKSGFQQVELSLTTTDALPSSDRRFATFEVLGPRKILVLADDPLWARAYTLALEVHGHFQPEVRTPAEIVTSEQFKPYVAVVLLSVARPGELWPKLADYARQGGHLLVALGREETKVEDFNSPKAQSILPGRVADVVVRPDADSARWEPFDRRHPLLAKFVIWREREDVGFLRYPRTARRYWQVVPSARENVIVAYAGTERHAAILERLGDRAPGQGRVVMLTTPIDFRPDGEGREPWNDYLSTAVNDGFYVVFANELLAYLTGSLEPTPWNFNSGQTISVPLVPTARFPEYTLDAPGITGSQTRLTRAETDSHLMITSTQFVGNARILADRGAWRVGFSLNVPTTEFDLTPTPIEEIEGLLGPGSVVSGSDEIRVKRVLEAQFGQSVDLFPWLMLALLGLFAVESILANRFYRFRSEVSAPTTLSFAD